MALKSVSGPLTMLRVHDIGGAYGPPSDRMDVEVVFKVQGGDDELALGFQLRADENRVVRQSMLDLLRDAFSYGWTVHADYQIGAGKHNGIATRVWLTRDRPPRSMKSLRSAPVLARREASG